MLHGLQGGMGTLDRPLFVAAGGGDPNFSDVSLLLHCDGTDGSTTFTDFSNLANSVSAGTGAEVDTAQSKFGGASLLTAATTGYLTVTNTASEFNFSTANDFTVEFWFRGAPVGGGFICAADRSFYMTCVSSTLYIGNGVTNPLVKLFTDTAGAFRHVAFTRSGSSLRLFFDGVEQASATSAISFGSDSDMWIGYDSTYGVIAGHYDDIRITKGVARYTANFTPHASAHPDS